MNDDHLLHLSECWFRLLLRLYPPDFRDEMGEGFVQTPDSWRSAFCLDCQAFMLLDASCTVF
jgi:hypothetical protein